MHEDIRLLKELQDIDYWIGELERSKEYIPDIMQKLKSDMTQATVDMEGSIQRLQQAKIEVKDLELNISSAKEKLTKYEEQMLTIKTNKEYDALVTQMEATREELSEFETKYLEVFEEIEELSPKISELEENNERIQKENVDQLNALQGEIDAVAGKVDEKENYRLNLKTKVPKRIMSIYERVRRGKGGDVVVSLKRGACGECFKAQPPQKIQEVKKGDTLQTCDSCGRILIWEGDD